MLWIRRMGEVLGSGAYAIQVVLATFFAGMGLGAWLGGRLADRWRGALGFYVGLELWIALWGFAFWPAVDAAEGLCASLAGDAWATGPTLLVKGVAAALVLLAPTLAMGASLPALVRHAVRGRGEVTSRLGGIYGWNTLGGAAGVAIAVFWWMPSFGLRTAALGAVLLNVVACALAFAGRRSGDTARERDPDGAVAAEATERRADHVLLGAALLAGFVSVGMEVLWTRALSARFLSTVFSFATILFVFLACLGSGALFLRSLERRGLLRRETAAVVLSLAGLSCVLSVAVLGTQGPVDFADFAGRGGWLTLQRRELWQALLVMAVPVWLFGLSFPLLARLLHREVDGLGREFGRLYLVNTLGSVAAPLVLAFGVLPVFGLKWTLLACGGAAIAYGLLVLAPWSGLDGRWRNGLGAATFLAAGVIALAGGDVALWSEAPGDRLVFYTDGAAASVSVVDTADGDRLLKVDNHYHLGATRTEFAQARQALVPILLEGDPDSVLALGLATGSSAGAAAAWGGLDIDIAEIIPELGRLLPFFEQANFGLAGRLAQDPRVRLLEVDGRHFVRATKRTYDLVLGDLFIPWRAGEGAMYTLENFRAVRSVLRPGGAFCQWLPLYQLRPADLEIITRTFCEVFEDVDAYWLYFNANQPAIGLLGRVPGERPPRAAHADGELRQRLLQRAGLSSMDEVHASWICGAARLREWSSAAPLETQDRPRIEFHAPAHRFGSSVLPAAENVPLALELMEPLAATGPYTGDAPDTVAARRVAIAHTFRADHARLFQDRPAEAVRELGEALAAAPDWPWIAWNLEQLVQAYAVGPHRDAAREAARLLTTSPTFAAQGHFLVAWTSLRGDDREAARQAVERALALDPDHAQSLELLEFLDRQEP